jgi:cell division protein ZapA (FtsZ GTPase activity inhibitor)
MLKNKDIPEENGSLNVVLSETHRTVLIKDLKITSNEVFEFLSGIASGEQREEELKRAIEVGVTVLQKVNIVSEADYFDKRIEQLGSKFNNKIDELQESVLATVEKNFDPAESKSYTRQINDFFEQQRRELQSVVRDAAASISKEKVELGKLIESSFDADDKGSHLSKLIERISTFEKEIEQKFDPGVRSSVISKLNDKLESIFSDSGTLSKILDERLSVGNPNSPLVKFKEDIRKEIVGLREELARQTSALETKEEAMQKSPEKGYAFEDVVFDLLQTVAKQDADIVADVSTEQGETKRKSGDFTYDVSKLSKRIVIEAKSRNITSVKNAITSLNESMQNRGAEYGIFVVESEDQLQKQIGIWNEYPDNKIITHSALLEVAVKVAKARLALEQAESIDVNVNEIRIYLGKVIDTLKKLSTIKKQVTAIKGSGDSIEKNADEIQSEIKEYVGMIDSELSKSN